MKSQLLEHFGDRIIIAEVNGKPNVVTFYSTASSILHDFHSQKHEDFEQEKAHMIATAAQFIKNYIKALKHSMDLYPSKGEMASSTVSHEYIPDCLKSLLRIVFAGKDVDVKLASLGQAIMPTARPMILLTPLNIGLGVQMHHHFQFKFLIESLNSRGFCCSYDEVKRYVRCTSITEQEIPQRYIVLRTSCNMQQTTWTTILELFTVRIPSMAWESLEFSQW